MKKTIIFGIGIGIQEIYEEEFYKFLDIEIIAFMDNDKSKAGTEINLYGRDVLVVHSSEIVKYIEYSFIISSSKYFNEIKAQLIANGVNSENIELLDNKLCDYFSKFVPNNMISGIGVEIGGPSDIFKRIYDVCTQCDGVNYSVDTVWSDNSSHKYKYNQYELGEQIINDAVSLDSIADEKYDFLLSSNNLEHIANPIKALSEFKRVVKSGGGLILILPNKEYTFDHLRDTVTFEHLLEDYHNNITEKDLTHLPEIIEKHDLSMDIPAGLKEDFYKRSLDNHKNRCLHQHVFDLDVLSQMADYFNLHIVHKSKLGIWFLIVLKK